jgi:hypothetical protein
MNNNTQATTTQLDATISALVSEWSARPFVWGVTDCCQFARACAQRVHGIEMDPPEYTGEREALRTLRRMGGFAGLLGSAGLQPRPVAQARRGDFVLFNHPGPGLFQSGLAMVTGTHAHAPTRIGLIAIERRAWLECWGVA